jgi:hypothetical protein
MIHVNCFVQCILSIITFYTVHLVLSSLLMADITSDDPEALSIRNLSAFADDSLDQLSFHHTPEGILLMSVCDAKVSVIQRMFV